MTDLHKKIVLFYGNNWLKFTLHILSSLFVLTILFLNLTTPLRWKFMITMELLFFSRVLKAPSAQEEIVDFRSNLPFLLS